MTPDRRASRAPTPGAWRAFEESLDGDVLRPGAASFPEASRLFNRRFQSIRPAALALPASAGDVAECLEFARRHDVPLAIRGGGHSYAGWSSGNDRLVIDVGRMDRITANSADAVIGAGVRIGDLSSTLAERGVTISGGTCPSVGVAGLTLGGGHGLVSRQFGLACDNLIEATIVTADGRVRVCSTAEEPDLFWALRGAGNGNFGVVTELRVHTHPVRTSVSADLRWPWTRAASVIAAWQEWAPDLPDEMWSAIVLHSGEHSPAVSVAAFSLGPQDELAERLERLSEGVSHFEIRTEPHLGTIRRFAGDQDEASSQPCYDARSDFIERSLSADAIEAVIATIEAAPSCVDAVFAAIALGGEVNRRPVEETAFIHRGHRFLAQYEAHWDPDGDRAAPGEAEAWLRAIHSVMQPHSSGEAYQNVPDPRLAQWRDAYYGPARARLERLKRRFDPERLFAFPHAL